jgi:tetratricopeptide (TPR) repeat protein
LPLLLHFHRASADPQDKELRRDLGIALAQIATRLSPVKHQPLGERIQPLLEEVVAAAPHDLDALDAKAQAFVLQAKFEQAAEVLEQVLKLAPQREPTLDTVASVYVRLGRYGLAIERWRAAIKINPHRWRYYVGLAGAHGELREWTQAIYAADQAIKLHPMAIEARVTRLTGLVMRNDKAGAEAELHALLTLDPHNAVALQKRYEELKREASRR